MLGSHHRLDMGSRWREQRIMGAKIYKDSETEKVPKVVIEDINNSASTETVVNRKQEK